MQMIQDVLLSVQNHPFIYTISCTFITIMCVTLYLHRSATHNMVTFNPIVVYFMRIWLWLTTGMRTREWVAVHKYHHKHTDTPLDPHSPVNNGWSKILFQGAFLYAKEKSRPEIMAEVSGDSSMPSDVLERVIGGNNNHVGVFIMLGIDLALFGLLGLFIWLVQIVWIPFWAAGIINGVSHAYGYTNYKKESNPLVIGNSKNIIPLGIIIGGEELHNNHHAEVSNPKFSRRWYEFDIGWLFIVMLGAAGLAKLNKNK